MMNLDSQKVGTTTNPTDHHPMVGRTTDPTNHYPIVSTTYNLANQVARKTKNTEGKPPFYFPKASPTVAQFHWITPQEGKLDYKAEASGANILSVMLRHDWFD